MTITAFSGPVITFVDGGILSNTSANQNPDQGPSLFFAASGLLDPRQPYTYFPGMDDSPVVISSTGGTTNAVPALGWLNATFQVADYAPGTATTTSLASSVSITASTTVALVTTTANSITSVNDSITNALTGATVTGLIRIDQKPGNILMGQGAVGLWDPANPPIGRAISITAVGGSLTTVNFTVSGYDAYGYPITSVMAGGTTSTAVFTGKTFKWLTSITASSTSSVTVSAGVADIYGFPMLATAVGYLDMYWNNTSVPTNNTVMGTFVAGSTATTTGASDVRGYINPSNITASNGTVKMQLWQSVSPANIQAANGVNSIFGVIPA
jgi:hypothetical protein